MLRFMGNEVAVAYDGLQGVAVTESFLPEVVLLDIGMPGLSGYEAAERLRQQPWGKNLTLIALTGWGMREDFRRTAESGFDFHLVKPINFQELQTILEE